MRLRLDDTVLELFFGDCSDCGKHCLVATCRFVAKENLATRCVFCIWKGTRFKWRAWRPEDSKLYVAPPSLLGPDGKPVHAAKLNANHA